MERKKGRSLPEVRRRNRVCIKELIYRKAPVTRTEIADELGLTLPTITTSVAQMLEEGLLIEEPVSEEYSGNGRKPLVLRFNPSAGWAVGVELGPYETAITLLDLAGTPLVSKIFPQAPQEYDRMLDALEEQLGEILQQAPGRPLGIGIGTPGFVNREDGIVRASLWAGWNEKPLADALSKRIGLPVLIDNNVRMRALGQDLLHGNGLPDLFAYFFVSKGIACPLIVKNRVLSGFTSGASEIGHMVMRPDGPICPTCGKRGCLEAVAGETAIRRDCEMLLQFGRAPVLRKLCGTERPDMKQILQADRSGDPDVREVMQQSMEYLGLALANVVNLISPGVVLVDGYIMQDEQNRERLLEAAGQRFYGLNAQEVHIRFLPFNRFGGAVGAAAAVLNQFCIQK